MRQLLPELIGTFLLVLVVGLLSTHAPTPLDPLVVAATWGALALVASPLSGGGCSPALALAAHLDGALSLPQLGRQIGAQVGGALAAAITVRLLAPVALPRPPVLDPGAAAGAELLGSLGLTWAFLATRGDALGRGAAIGGVALGALVALAPLSGAPLTPALAVVQPLFGATTWSAVPMLLGAEALGALAATWLWRLVRAEREPAA